MYALAIIRYRKPLEDVLVQQDAHRAYLRGLKENGRAHRLRTDGPAVRRSLAAARRRRRREGARQRPRQRPVLHSRASRSTS